MKKRTFYLLLMIIFFSLTGCGKGVDESTTSSKVAEQKRVAGASYIEIPLSVPHHITYGEEVFGNQLYYLANENEQIVLARVDLNDLENADGLPAEVFPLGISAENQLFWLSADTDGIIHILACEYDEETRNFGGPVLHQVDEKGLVTRTVAISEAIRDWPLGFRVDG
ncbi:MAG: hypothetical protein LBE79_07925, partial [Tannerella sp.]|nr:hypothetical protein [Tannerella sp.]